MDRFPNLIANTLPLLIVIVGYVVVMVWIKRGQRRTSGYLNAIEKQTSLLEQQLALHRETNELLKKLIESHR